MKNIVVSLVLGFVSLVAVSAVAEPAVEAKIPDGYNLCRVVLVDSKNPAEWQKVPACAAAAKSDPGLAGRIANLAKGLAELRAKVARAQETADEALAKASANSDRITILDGDVAGLKSDVADHGERIDVQEGRLDGLASEVGKSNSKIERIEERVVSLEKNDTKQNLRLDLIEEAQPRLYAAGGVVGLFAIGSPVTYSGGSLVLGLSLPVSPKTSVEFEAGALVAAQPGVDVRVGLDFAIGDKVDVGSGVYGLGLGLDQAADSGVVATGLDLRVQYHATDAVDVGLTVMPLGVTAHAVEGMHYAPGAAVGVGYNF